MSCLGLQTWAAQTQRGPQDCSWGLRCASSLPTLPSHLRRILLLFLLTHPPFSPCFLPKAPGIPYTVELCPFSACSFSPLPLVLDSSMFQVHTLTLLAPAISVSAPWSGLSPLGFQRLTLPNPPQLVKPGAPALLASAQEGVLYFFQSLQGGEGNIFCLSNLLTSEPAFFAEWRPHL